VTVEGNSESRSDSWRGWGVPFTGLSFISFDLLGVSSMNETEAKSVALSEGCNDWHVFPLDWEWKRVVASTPYSASHSPIGVCPNPKGRHAIPYLHKDKRNDNASSRGTLILSHYSVPLLNHKALYPPSSVERTRKRKNEVPRQGLSRGRARTIPAVYAETCLVGCLSSFLSSQILLRKHYLPIDRTFPLLPVYYEWLKWVNNCILYLR